MNIISRPGPHCPFNGPRLNCKGVPVSFHEDGCSFCGPLARIFYNSERRIDIYLFDIQISDNKLQIIDQGTMEYTTKPSFTPINWYFPLSRCLFMGLTVMCPIKSKKILKKYYLSLEASMECKNGLWNQITYFWNL